MCICFNYPEKCQFCKDLEVEEYYLNCDLSDLMEKNENNTANRENILFR